MEQTEYEERFRRLSPKLRELTEWIVLHWEDWSVIIGAREAGPEVLQSVLEHLMETPFEELQAVMRYRLEYLSRQSQSPADASPPEGLAP